MTPRAATALGELIGIIVLIVIVVHIIFSISRTASNTKKQLEILQRQEKEKTKT